MTKTTTQLTKEIIGITRIFEGIFKLYQTDNVFQFIQQTREDIIKDLKDTDDSTILRYGKIQPNVKIKSKGVVVGILNKKEGLFVCNKYPLTIFKFPLNNLTP